MMDYEPGAHMTNVIMLKICLFIAARSAETNSNAVLNLIRANSFYFLCNSSDFYILHDTLFYR